MRSRTRWIIALFAVLMGGVLLGACQTSEPSGDVGYGPARGAAERVLTTDDRFNTPVIEAEAGDRLVVEITNVGDNNHEFAIPDMGLTTGTIEPGESAWARFEVPKGTTTFVCSYHGEMEGVIKAR
jgi:plastocyanin